MHGKIAAPDERDAHGMEIVRTDLLVIDSVRLGVGDRCVAFHSEPALYATPEKRIDKSSGRRLYSWKLRNALGQLGTEAIASVAFVFSIRNIESQSDKMIGSEAGTVCQQMRQAPEH